MFNHPRCYQRGYGEEVLVQVLWIFQKFGQNPEMGEREIFGKPGMMAPKHGQSGHSFTSFAFSGLLKI